MKNGILVVEDDREIRETVVEILEDSGYACTSASDGQEALDALAAASALPALILLDLRMPVLDGAGFRAAQLEDPRFAAIPVVVVSADAQVKEAAELLRVDDYLRKPVDFRVLLSTVARFTKA